MTSDKLFDFPASLAPFAHFFRQDVEPWKWIAEIKNALASLDWSDYPTRMSIPHGVFIKGKVYIHPTVILPPYAYIEGPAWIGAKTEIRPSAYIRGNVIIGEGCVIGCRPENFKDRAAWGIAVVGQGVHIGDFQTVLPRGIVSGNLPEGVKA